MKENIFSIKINGKIYDTDKSNELLSRYDEHFKDYNFNEVKLLELGVRNGGSMLFWNDYFNTSKIIGLDLDQVIFDKNYPNLKVYEGSQTDLDLLDEIRQDNASEGFDIIIDDCSHIAELTKISFWHIFNNHLKNGGLYIIEDWGCGYWSKWPDGHKYKASRQNIIRQALDRLIRYLLKIELSSKTKKTINWLSHYIRKKKYKSHNYGMVGLIKELVDECGMRDITSTEFGIGGSLESKFEYLKIYPGVVFIKKK